MSPKELINHACVAQKRAKAPYSNYKVGAALWIKNDIIVLGCNIESKAYPTTLCAERVAIFSALAQGYESFSALALITSDGAFPCGSCRQILHEYANGIPLYIADNSCNYVTHSTTELLPYPFG
mgnify:CR=1 FL=1